ncbi:MAG TPA: hypothetical protein VK971_01905 [Thiohalobacter sp.]|nr:hypothetical protein [Thiohalobacter sp.]
MDNYVVWPDGRNHEAELIEAASMPEAIDQAAEKFGIAADRVNIIDAERIGEAAYHGVAHVIR